MFGTNFLKNIIYCIVFIDGIIGSSLQDAFELGSLVSKFLSSKDKKNVKAVSRSINENINIYDINATKCNKLFHELHMKLKTIYHQLKDEYTNMRFQNIYEFQIEYLKIFKLVGYLESNLMGSHPFVPDIAVYFLGLRPTIIPASLILHKPSMFTEFAEYGINFKKLYTEYSCGNINFLFQPLSTVNFQEKMQHYHNVYIEAETRVLRILNTNAVNSIRIQIINDFKSIYSAESIIYRIFKIKSHINHEYSLVSKRIQLFDQIRQSFTKRIAMSFWEITKKLDDEITTLCTDLNAKRNNMDYSTIEKAAKSHYMERIHIKINHIKQLLDHVPPYLCRCDYLFCRFYGSKKQTNDYWIRMYVYQNMRNFDTIGFIDVIFEKKKLIQHCNVFQGCAISNDICREFFKHCQQLVVMLHHYAPFEQYRIWDFL